MLSNTVNDVSENMADGVDHFFIVLFKFLVNPVCMCTVAFEDVYGG